MALLFLGDERVQLHESKSPHVSMDSSAISQFVSVCQELPPSVLSMTSGGRKNLA